MASNTFSSCLLDTSFDLDEALTLPENFSQQITHSNSLLADIPTVLITGDVVCAVCMEGFRSGIGGKKVPCGHVYHEACISSWLSHCNSCPLCRCEISS
ncbi:unnamed protein product [Dovyalis caffra]|uniref:RING-type E3 ubiquitin transferase n=1 Tax=Dovyalis caffra TaxID=77055 RepID=A0AAV1RNP7_9ROSI|nr:unnamed protein product [Dovyalis caffra]